LEVITIRGCILSQERLGPPEQEGQGSYYNRVTWMMEK
jgi:hypothetical protein